MQFGLDRPSREGTEHGDIAFWPTNVTSEENFGYGWGLDLGHVDGPGYNESAFGKTCLVTMECMGAWYGRMRFTMAWMDGHCCWKGN